jgi:thiol:disulfide interchange protein
MAIAPAAAQSGLAGPDAVSDVRTTVVPEAVGPGQAFTVVVNLDIREGLHIQASKPLQDYLIGTQLKPAPVEGIVWQDPRFPPSHERVDPTLGTLAEYSGSLRIELPGSLQADARPGPRTLALTLQYQACSDEGACYPPKTVPIQATLQVAAGPVATAAAPSAAEATLAQPQASTPAPSAGARPEASGTPAGPRLPWERFTTQRLAELTAAGKTVLIDFTADWCPNCKLNELIALNTQATADLVRRNGIVPLLADFTHQDTEIKNWLTRFNSISVPLTVIVPGSNPTQPIILRDSYRQATLLTALEAAGPSVGKQQTALTLETPLQLMQAQTSQEGATVLVAETAGEATVWWYLLAGFLGGFILNFMPCVLPVISIKVLSLVGQAGESRGRVFGLGVVFAAGMITLFLVLGVLVTVVGQTWGALFQSAAFLFVMLGILVAMACSLFGAFTLGVPSAVGDADVAIKGEGYTASFGKGMLAVLLGTPCSGPFLGPVLAWAAGQSAAGRSEMGMLVFLSMGLGMAFPFVVLAAKPGWMRFLPRPGAWMETFKQAMAFLLLLTAVYILWLLQNQVLVALLFSVGIAFAAWLYGKLVSPLRSDRANWIGRGVVFAIVVVTAWTSFAAMPAGTSTQAMKATPVQAATLMDGQR